MDAIFNAADSTRPDFYCIFFQNCEHYTNRVRNGNSVSHQVDRVVYSIDAAFLNALAFLIVAAIYAFIKKI
ncbi:hypothetical protein L596_027096 [Steinernema carpocapsae]|uniref:LRAT domain-containing protein n=1 Tax=Steinernema carpocapsae TaxID=34508 RepID=A0A4U5M3E4_STECR|nr:hypothetical protein L596_027096 [Steinernema carpocapsae]